MQTKKGNYSLSWKIYKNLHLCESTMHHCRHKNEFDRSHRFLACLSKRVCVQWAVRSSNANYIFPRDWRCAGMHTTMRVYTKTLRQPAASAVNMRECLFAFWLDFHVLCRRMFALNKDTVPMLCYFWLTCSQRNYPHLWSLNYSWLCTHSDVKHCNSPDLRHRHLTKVKL